MRYRPIALFVLGFFVGCGGSRQASDDAQTVQMRDQAVRDLETEERERAERTPPPQEAVEEPGEELAVEMFELELNKPVRAESGLAVNLAAQAPYWTFEFDHHGRRLNVVHQGEPLYVEGVAFGHLYVITRLGEGVQLTLRSDAPESPLSMAEALEIARRERASRLGCEGVREVPEEAANGTVVLRIVDDRGKEGCRIVVGRYTRSVVDL